MVLKPYFGRPQELQHPAQVFVLMPFSGDMKPVYDDHIKKVANGLGLSVARADDFFTAHAVIADIWSAVHSAEVVVADCTGKNPNVFYEIGMAHVLGKKVILITQNPNDVPVDVRHFRFIPYIYTPPGMKDLEAALENTLKTELRLNAKPSQQN
jgi:hypothetical protein